MSAPKHTPKKFINDPTQAVTEYISGLLLQYPHHLQKLSHHNVLLSSHIRYDRVNILSGGGSGHEPSHAGWIGEGMLTGAILGGMFASPSVVSILAAIRAVTPDPQRTTPLNDDQDKDDEDMSKNMGCLLIVKNYTGDRLNFGMAAEIAKGEGRRVEMVVVSDDTALERQKGVTGARGVAGTVLVHKVAGAAAARGYSLEQVAEIAREMARSVRTLGVALDAVTIPGSVVMNDRLDSGMIEIGMGIHGEAGRFQSPWKSAKELATIMIDTIREYGVDKEEQGHGTPLIMPTFDEQDDLCVLVNNLGGVSNFEMSILAHSVVTQLEDCKNHSTMATATMSEDITVQDKAWSCRVSRLYVGSFMTSFDMRGASVSIASLSKAKYPLGELLDDFTDAPAWPKSNVVGVQEGSRCGAIRQIQERSDPVSVPVPETSTSIPVKLKGSFGSDDIMEKAAIAACNSLIESEPILTKYDTIVGDGDCGITMKRGAMEILSRIQSKDIDTHHPVVFFENIATAISASMGGTSGILLEIMFRKMSTYLKGQSVMDGNAVKRAFQEGVQAVSFYGGATAGSRTMLDALLPAVEVMVKIDGKEGDAGSFENIAKAASEGALATASMSKASAGRSNYLSEDTLRGTPDPGAVAVGVVLSAIGKVL